MAGLDYKETAARPEAVLSLPDGYDCSTGHTFSLKIGDPGSAAVLTKTANITGGPGTVTVAWAAGELDTIPPGLYTLQLTMTIGGLPRVYETTIEIGAAIT